MFGLTKEEIVSNFSTNSQLTINDLANIIEANNQRLAKDITEAINKAKNVDEMMSQLQNLAYLTDTQFK